MKTIIIKFVTNSSQIGNNEVMKLLTMVGGFMFQVYGYSGLNIQGFTLVVLSGLY